LKDIIRGFHRITKLPQICGAIDGSHVKLYKKPPTKYTPADYWCRHDVHKVLLQGICDSNRNFLDVCVLAPGGTHDATHMRSSEFIKKLMRRRILRDTSINIEGETIKSYIIGDSTYPLLQQIQKPFNAKLSGQEDQDAFDKCLRQRRIKIENTFGILKNRWGILKNLNVDVKYAATVITACCVLHNFWRYNCNDGQLTSPRDYIDIMPNNNDKYPETEDRQPSERSSARAGSRIRKALCQYWLDNVK
jgi:hypothetical protein